jgi:predicted ester cyclase
MDNEAIFQRYQDALLTPDELVNVIHPNFVAHDLPPPAGRDALIGFRRSLGQSFPDMRIKILDILSEGDRVAARMLLEASHKRQLRGQA